MCGMGILLGDELRTLTKSPFGALMILAAAIVWAIGTVLLRKWKPPMAQNTLSGWMMLVGWLPIVLAAPFFDSRALGDTLAALSPRGWFAIFYNIFLAGTVAHWAWFTLARTLPVAVSSLSSLPVPVVGVFSGMLVLGERPGAQEWIALALVVLALFTVLWQPQKQPAPLRRWFPTTEPISQLGCAARLLWRVLARASPYLHVLSRRSLRALICQLRHSDRSPEF